MFINILAIPMFMGLNASLIVTFEHYRKCLNGQETKRKFR